MSGDLKQDNSESVGMGRAIMLALAALLLPSFLLGGAYIGEYGFGLFPCEMCWWQRYPHFAAIGLALCAIILGVRGKARPAMSFAVLASISIMISGLIGGFHAGVEYGYWSGPTACSGSGALDMSGGFAEAMAGANLVRCDEAAWTLFGISLAGYNFLISMTGGLLLLISCVGSKNHKNERCR